MSSTAVGEEHFENGSSLSPPLQKLFDVDVFLFSLGISGKERKIPLNRSFFLNFPQNLRFRVDFP